MGHPPMLCRQPLRRCSPAPLTWAQVIVCAALLGSAEARADTAPAPCRVPGIAQELRCGSVSRPLDPSRADGPRIEVQYLLVPALARRKQADPVVVLAGGPGQSAMALAPTVLPMLSRLNNRRDLVFIDQRGTGRSAPLVCEEGRDDPIAAQADAAWQRAQIAACRRRLESLPHVQGPEGLRHYTTAVAVQDMDAVRRQLGAATWNLVGASYGTRVALELQRQYPASVRRMVLDGVAPPDMALPASLSTDAQAVLDALLDACAAEPACARAYPHLREDWARLLASLPLPVRVSDPRTGRTEALTLDRPFLLNLVRAPGYLPALAAALPAALNAAAAGRLEPLLGLHAMFTPREDRQPGRALALGMHFSVVCAEDLPRLADARDAPGRDFGRSAQALYERVCAEWPRGAVPPAFYRVGPSAVPALLLSGGLDPVTPPRHAARVAAALGPKATHRIAPQAGHGLLGIGCARDLVHRFIAAESEAEALAVDSRCLEAIPRPPMFIPPGGAAP